MLRSAAKHETFPEERTHVKLDVKFRLTRQDAGVVLARKDFCRVFVGLKSMDLDPDRWVLLQCALEERCECIRAYRGRHRDVENALTTKGPIMRALAHVP